MIDKSIYAFLTFIFLIGILCSFLASEGNEMTLSIVPESTYLDDDMVNLLTEVEYDVFLTNEKTGKETFWQLKNLERDSVVRSDFLVDAAYKFEVPGTYKIKAFRGQRLLVDSVVEVLPGLRVAFEVPEDLYVKKEIHIENRSMGAKNFLWTLIDEGGDTIITDINSEFSWVPEQTGTYKIELLGISEIGNEKRITEKVKVVREPKEYVKPIAEKNPVRKSASPIRKPSKPIKTSGVSFMLDFSSSGSEFIGPKAPDLATIEYRPGTTKIEITPKRTLRISTISYWGNIDDPGNYSYSIVCTSQTEGENKFSRKALTAKSANEANVDRLTYPRSSALISGETYELVITSDNPCMGYFTPRDNLILADEKYGSFRFLSETSAVFNLKLEY